MQDAWFSYDGIALEYSAGAEQIYFADPAADLIRLLKARTRGMLLDVGSGSGVVAATALRSGGYGRVVACDASIAMLGVARKRLPEAAYVMATLPRLPFPDRTFDAVTAGFVLSHLSDVAGALSEIRRVLKKDGWLGATSWSNSAGESAPGQLWDSIARELIPAEVLQTAAKRNLPSEDQLSMSDSLAQTVERAGFADVSAEQTSYEVRIATKEFLRSRLISLASRYMIAHLPAAAWTAFQTTAELALHQQFGERLNFQTTVNFVTGRRTV